MDLGLAGRKALVTGASKGIGLATAKLLAQEGCRVVLVSRDQDRLEAARGAILAEVTGADLAIHAADVSRDETAATLAAAHGDVNILVNNAGAIPLGDIASIDQARWREAWDLKVFGFIGVTRAFYALMAARGAGVVVNIIGMGGEKVDAAYIAGSAGNAALMAFTRALGGASPAQGVRVVGINPGPIATDRMETRLRTQAAQTLGDADRWRELTAGMPFGRPGRPEEIAAAVAFLASDRSAFTTGTVLTIDGGLANKP
ncbi:short-chain dehydrogenase/reductase [Chelatococcus reniformis]|uniref:Short-chain dehydrogenase/reductase n=1 Tax=Chelatococcus reniformis TaxID=1494448 RepID=A0A916XFG7_9HYPH|nr:short-chain dehydrogenase/reductase [Chelatococcus reniformis]GGC66770.1 short-chain dehydrogenase/reductase [Chelatococcus reniformis]